MTFWIALALVLFHVVRGGWAFALLAVTGTFELSTPIFWLWYSQRREVQVGAETLIGRVVEVAEECRPYGSIRVHGELWRAHCEPGAAPGERVTIVGREGLTLEVARADG